MCYVSVMCWIWLGAIFMSLGGLLAILDKRYRRRKSAKEKQAVQLSPAQALTS